MPRKKLKRRQAITSINLILEESKPQFNNLQGNWGSIFDNVHPLTLEIGCGRGEYTLGFSERFPNQNFIGLDIKGERLWQGAQIAIEHHLQNVRFIRISAECVDQFFKAGEVSTIWITHPDPHPKNSKRRLTHPRFLAKYKHILRSQGEIFFKTDDPLLYLYTLNSIQDLLGTIILKSENMSEDFRLQELNIETNFGQKDLAGSRKLYFIQFTL